MACLVAPGDTGKATPGVQRAVSALTLGRGAEEGPRGSQGPPGETAQRGAALGRHGAAAAGCTHAGVQGGCQAGAGAQGARQGRENAAAEAEAEAETEAKSRATGADLREVAQR